MTLLLKPDYKVLKVRLAASSRITTTEVISVAEALGMTWVASENIGEAIGVSDDNLIILNGQLFDDAAAVSDSPVMALTFLMNGLADAATIADALAVAISLSHTEGVGLGDVAIVVDGLGAADALALGDNYGATNSWVDAQADMVTISEGIAFVIAGASVAANGFIINSKPIG